MEVTRNVILDLLPLYIGNEVCADTRALIDKYLETDPELAEIAEKATKTELPEDVPIPLTKEDKMEAYREAKRLMFLRTIILAGIISFSVIAALVLALIGAAYFIPS
jgi:hypothetical protein